MTSRTTWRLTPEQLCHLTLLLDGHLAPQQSFAAPQEGPDAAGVTERPGAVALSPTLMVPAAAAPAEGGELGLLDPEGVQLAVVTGTSTHGATSPTAGAAAAECVTVSGTLLPGVRVAPLDFPELYADSATLTSLARGGTAVLTAAPPTVEVEAALDAHLRAGAAATVLLAVPSELTDRHHATVMAWQAALGTRPGVALFLLRAGEGDAAMALALVAAGVAGVTAAAFPDSPAGGRPFAALATDRGVGVLDLGTAVPSTELAVAGAPAYRGRYSDDVWPHVERAFPPPSRQGLTLMFTGLSGSGKSTVARAVVARMRLLGDRRVTLLDGDEVRTHLTSGLGFSAADRATNVRRIAWVAALVTRYGGVAVCAPIAPYASMRAQARAVVGGHGTFVLVHISTSLAECERRDRKGLYARARRGEIPFFTGISDPYETPTDADLTIDTEHVPVPQAVELVVEHLRRRGLVEG